METCNTEEPYEENPHVRICGGVGRVIADSTRTTNSRNIGSLGLVLGVALATSGNGTNFAADPPQRIDRITWIIHPYCWSMAGDTIPPDVNVKLWKACLAWERDNHQPETVRCTAVGEGFEQCAMIWKGMLPEYLGLATPIENDATLSVTGQLEVVFGKFQEWHPCSDASCIAARQVYSSNSERNAVPRQIRDTFRSEFPSLVCCKGFSVIYPSTRSRRIRC